MAVRSKSKSEIAELYPGPILVLAGPGTGKTHTLARRIRWLICEKDVDPDDVTVITFTKEAAANMRERISDENQKDVYIKPDIQPKRICTMHSYGHNLIRRKYRKCGLKLGFDLLSENLIEIMMQDAAQIVDQKREEGKLTAECRRNGRCEPNGSVKCRICNEYKSMLRRLNFIDYDDLIFLACDLLNSESSILKTIQSETKHLLVDEYQDINTAQFNFIKLLCSGQENGLYVVGDDDQSIYSWRGGTPEFIMNFKKHYGNHAIVEELIECRRCSSHILKGGLAVVRANTPHRIKKKKLHSISKNRNKISIHDVPSDTHEAFIIAKKAARALRSGDVMILIPRYAFSSPIKEALQKKRVGYLCRLEVQKTGLYLIDAAIKWTNNVKDNLALRLCLEAIMENRQLEIPFDKGSTNEGLLSKISKLWLKVDTRRITLYDLLMNKAKTQNDFQYIVKKLEEIKGTINSRPQKFLEAVSRILRPWKSVKALRNELSKWIDDGSSRNIGGNIVRILTMQGAKGLDCDVVFVVGLDEGVFPKNGISEEDMQEMRRLLYVSMTRARKELHLFHARKRKGNIAYIKVPEGNHKSTLAISPLLAIIPDEHFDKVYHKSK